MCGMHFLRAMRHDKTFGFGASRFHGHCFNRCNLRDTNRLRQLRHADRGGRNRLDRDCMCGCLYGCLHSRYRLNGFSHNGCEITAVIGFIRRIRVKHTGLSPFAVSITVVFRGVSSLIGRHAFFFTITASTTTTPTTATALFAFTRRAGLIGLQCVSVAVLLRFLARQGVVRQFRHHRFALRQRFDGGFRLRLPAFAPFRTFAPFTALTAIGGFSTFRCAFATVLTRFTRLAHFARLAGFTSFSSLTRFATFACFTRLAAFTSTTRFTRLAGFTGFARFTRFLWFPFLAARLTTTRRARCAWRSASSGGSAITRSSTTTAITVPVTPCARTLWPFATRRTCRCGRCDRRGSRFHFGLDAKQVLQPADKPACRRSHYRSRRDRSRNNLHRRARRRRCRRNALDHCFLLRLDFFGALAVTRFGFQLVRRFFGHFPGGARFRAAYRRDAGVP